MTRTPSLFPRIVAVLFAAALCTPVVVDAKSGKHGHGHGHGHAKAWKHSGWKHRLRLFREVVIERPATRVARRFHVHTSTAPSATYRARSTADGRMSSVGAVPSNSRNVASTSTLASTQSDAARSAAVGSFMADHPPR